MACQKKRYYGLLEGRSCFLSRGKSFSVIIMSCHEGKMYYDLSEKHTFCTGVLWIARWKVIRSYQRKRYYDLIEERYCGLSEGKVSRSINGNKYYAVPEEMVLWSDIGKLLWSVRGKCIMVCQRERYYDLSEENVLCNVC